MFAAFEESSRQKMADHEKVKARGDADALSQLGKAQQTEALSYSKAGLTLLNGDIPGFINEARKGIEAMVEQRRIVDGDV